MSLIDLEYNLVDVVDIFWLRGRRGIRALLKSRIDFNKASLSGVFVDEGDNITGLASA